LGHGSVSDLISSTVCKLLQGLSDVKPSTCGPSPLLPHAESVVVMRCANMLLEQCEFLTVRHQCQLWLCLDTCLRYVLTLFIMCEWVMFQFLKINWFLRRPLEKANHLSNFVFARFHYRVNLLWRFQFICLGIMVVVLDLVALCLIYLGHHQPVLLLVLLRLLFGW
jgi:hypothetical protein